MLIVKVSWFFIFFLPSKTLILGLVTEVLWTDSGEFPNLFSITTEWVWSLKLSTGYTDGRLKYRSRDETSFWLWASLWREVSSSSLSYFAYLETQGKYFSRKRFSNPWIHYFSSAWWPAGPVSKQNVVKWGFFYAMRRQCWWLDQGGALPLSV